MRGRKRGRDDVLVGTAQVYIGSYLEGELLDYLVVQEHRVMCGS